MTGSSRPVTVTSPVRILLTKAVQASIRGPGAGRPSAWVGSCRLPKSFLMCPSSGAGGRIDLEVVHCMEELGWGDLKGGGGSVEANGRMSWSVGSGCRVSIAYWRSWPLRGARLTSPYSLCWRVVVRVVARRRLPLARRDSISARMVSALGGGWGRSFRALLWGTSAIVRRMISVAKSEAAVIDFKSSMGLGRIVDRQRSMRPGRMWNAAILSSAMALVPLTVRRSILSSMALVGAIYVWWKV